MALLLGSRFLVYHGETPDKVSGRWKTILSLAVGALFVYLFARTAFARRLGRHLAAAGDPAGMRVTPLAWGMTAALLGTLFANIFYLTMSFYYFYVFVALLLALPIVYGPRAEAAARKQPAPSPRPAPVPA